MLNYTKQIGEDFMSFSTTITITGWQKQFAISPKCKRYTLIDNGFTETKAGNFQLVRQLDAIGDVKRNIQLKLTVSKDLKTLKYTVVSANGLSTVDLYKMKNNTMIVEKFEFLIEGLVDRDVLIEQ